MNNIFTSMVNATDTATKHLLIEGELTLAKATDLQEKLCDYIAHNQEVYLVLANVSAIDLSCIQILMAYQKACQKAEKLFNIKWEAEASQKELLQKTGFGSFTLMPALAAVC